MIMVHVDKHINTTVQLNLWCIYNHTLSYSYSLQRYVPHFRTMFSSLRHHPHQTITLDTTDPVPKHISRQWGGYRNQARETLVRYKKSDL